MSRLPYASLCAVCGHLASNHGLMRGDSVREGRYRCAHCNCEMAQDGPTLPLETEVEYDAYIARAGRRANIYATPSGSTGAEA